MQKSEPKIFNCYWDECEGWMVHGKSADNGMMIIMTAVSYEDYQKIEQENAKLKEANKVLFEALNKAIKSAEFFSRHADCKKDTWSCKCSFCRDTESGKNLRNAKEALEQYEKIINNKGE